MDAGKEHHHCVVIDGAGKRLLSRRVLNDETVLLDLIGDVLASAGITTVLTGARMPRMNAITERWVKTLRAELLDRMLIWNEAHLRHALREYERHYNLHRTHRSLAAAAPLQARPEALRPNQIERLTVRRQDRLGGVIHEYRSAA